MNCYIMRHGTTVWNEKGISQGRSSNKLSRAGIELVKAASLRHKNTPFEIIFCSPLMRTVQTANLMNCYHNAKIIKNDYLTEIDQGFFSGKDKSKLTEYQKQKKLERSKEFGMESYAEAFDRAKEFAEYLKNQKYENVLIVTHNCIATFLHEILSTSKVNFSDCSNYKNFDNAEIREVVVDKNKN